MCQSPHVFFKCLLAWFDVTYQLLQELAPWPWTHSPTVLISSSPHCGCGEYS